MAQWTRSRPGATVVGNRSFSRDPFGTIFYLHDPASGVVGSLPGTSTQSATTPDVTATGASTNRDMSLALGTSQVDAGITYGVGQTHGWIRRYVSAELDAQTIPAGDWTVFGAASETILSLNALFIGALLYVWRPSTGAKVGNIFDRVTTGATEPDTAETALYQIHPGISQTTINGDVLILEIWASSAAIVGTGDWFYDGTAGGSTTSNAATLLAPVALVFGTSVAAVVRLRSLMGVGI